MQEPTISDLLVKIQDLENRLATQQAEYSKQKQELDNKLKRLENKLTVSEKVNITTSRRRLLKTAAGILAVSAASSLALPATEVEAAGGTGVINFNGIGAAVGNNAPYNTTNNNQVSGLTTFTNDLTAAAPPGTLKPVMLINNNTTGVGAMVDGLQVVTAQGVAISGTVTSNQSVSGVVGITGDIAQINAVSTSTGGVTGGSSVAGTHGVTGIASGLGSYGLYGVSTNAPGVYGTSANSYGGQFSSQNSNRAQLYLTPSSAANPTATGLNQLGEIFMDKFGRIWVYTNDVSGTGWKQLTEVAVSGTLTMLPGPDRFVQTDYNGNVGYGVGSNPGPVLGFYPAYAPTNPNTQVKTYQLAGKTGENGQTIPAGAKAVLGFFGVQALDPTTTAGFATVWPTGQSFPPTATIDFAANPQFTSTQFTALLGANGSISVATRNKINVFIDIVGYYL